MFSPHASRIDRRHQHLISLLVKYHACGAYLRDMALVGRNAVAYLDALPPPAKGANEAMVLDIDETSLINDWPKLLEPVLEGKDYDPKAWDTWARRAASPASRETLALFHRARARGVHVFFITGRPEYERKYVEKNLAREGYEGWTEIIMEPLTRKRTPIFPNVNMYKTAARASIVELGYRIVLNMGDQASDLRGGYADKTFQLPNPFYTVL
jgi:predicted secreted acid phosphatase